MTILSVSGIVNKVGCLRSVMADAGGRRNFVILYAVTYALSCLTKHAKDYYVLMLGRLLGGVATSLLFSVFDSWLIRAHALAKINKDLLSQSFSAAIYGNSAVAIIAGLIANKIANVAELKQIGGDGSTSMIYVGGYIAPFDMSLFSLIICGILAFFLWDENYGGHAESKSSDGGCLSNMRKALKITTQNSNILLCGLISSLFEGSMYIFVFMWTPALTSLSSKDSKLPFGLIFSTFMVSCMLGATLFSLVVKVKRVESIATMTFLLSACCFMIIASSKNDTIVFLAMNTFEVCVGLYFPSMGTLKSSIVPESHRSAIYNIYRIPLNFVVMASLLTHLTPRTSFYVCFLMLTTACACMYSLEKRRAIECPHGSTNSETSSKDKEMEKLINLAPVNDNKSDEPTVFADDNKMEEGVGL